MGDKAFVLLQGPENSWPCLIGVAQSLDDAKQLASYETDVPLTWSGLHPGHWFSQEVDFVIQETRLWP